MKQKENKSCCGHLSLSQRVHLLYPTLYSIFVSLEISEDVHGLPVISEDVRIANDATPYIVVYLYLWMPPFSVN